MSSWILSLTLVVNNIKCVICFFVWWYILIKMENVWYFTVKTSWIHVSSHFAECDSWLLVGWLYFFFFPFTEWTFWHQTPNSQTAQIHSESATNAFSCGLLIWFATSTINSRFTMFAVAFSKTKWKRKWSKVDKWLHSSL